MKKHLYAVSGMHCASCELLIEKHLTRLPSVARAEASSSKGRVAVYFHNQAPSLDELNRRLNPEGYTVSAPDSRDKESFTPSFLHRFTVPLLVATAIFLAFLGLNRLGLSDLVNVSTASSLPAFVIFGLLAGVSTCAALVGSLVLSLSAHRQKPSVAEVSLVDRLQPHLLFNAGRLAAFALFGLILGAAGSRLGFSLTLNAFLVITISLLMIAHGLKMLGIPSFNNFRLALPKSLSRRVSGWSDSRGWRMAALAGALTVFLPCGFTVTAESLALVSGDPVQGALIMSAFALGTVPGLLAIGFSAVKMATSPYGVVFSRVAGVLVLLFAAFNINSQLNVLGLPGLNNVTVAGNLAESKANQSADDLPELVDGKQVIKMQASTTGYSPAYFKIRAGVPVRWEITDTGTGGCTSAVMSRDLFSGTIDLTPGDTSVKEFTVAQPGRYKFSCWMGMVSGIIDVVAQAGDTVTVLPTATEV